MTQNMNFKILQLFNEKSFFLIQNWL